MILYKPSELRINQHVSIDSHGLVEHAHVVRNVVHSEHRFITFEMCDSGELVSITLDELAEDFDGVEIY